VCADIFPESSTPDRIVQPGCPPSPPGAGCGPLAISGRNELPMGTPQAEPQASSSAAFLCSACAVEYGGCGGMARLEADSHIPPCPRRLPVWLVPLKPRGSLMRSYLLLFARFFRPVCILACLLSLLALLASADTPVEERLRQIQRLLQQGSWEDARNQLTDALLRFPGEASLYNFMGVVEAQAGNYPAAESNFGKALELSPRFTGAAINLGKLYQENYTLDAKARLKALQVYQRILAYDPANTEALFQTAVLSLQQGQYLAALTTLARLPSQVQARPQPLAVRCATLAALERTPEAEKAAAALLVHPDLTAADVLLILPALEKNKKNELEERLLEGLTSRSLHTPESLRSLGLFYERQGQFDRARQTLEAAVTSPVSVPLLIDLARVAYKSRDLKGTLGYLAHARDLEPGNFGVHFFFGIVCTELDLLIEATKSLREAVALSPEHPYANFALGSVLMQGSDPLDGLPYVKKYCQLKPKDPRGRLALGAAYFRLGNHELAAKELEAVSALPEAAAGANYFLGRIAKLQGNRAEAYRLIQLSLKANPDFADALVELGQLEMREKNYAAAAKALQRAVALEPDSFQANMHLLRLYQATHDSRAEAQRERFDEISKKRAEKEASLLRTIEVRPY
jgi:tetratricopeptide (TPR) repeat protein